MNQFLPTPHVSPRLEEPRRPMIARHRHWLIVLAMAGLLMPRVSAADARQAEVDAAVGRGLAFLVRQQNADGSFGTEGPAVAVTGLSLLAFLSAGHAPERGRFGLEIRRAIDYLLERAPADGYYGDVDESRMYGHGIAMMALAEAYGVEPDQLRRERIVAAVEKGQAVILRAQAVSKPPAHAGGWRYLPQSVDSDLSLAGWNVLALRAGQNIGVFSPEESAQRAREYVLRCFRPEQGGFAYQPGQQAAVGMTGVGVTALSLLDAADRPEVKAGGEFLAAHADVEPGEFAFYSTYYLVQGAFQAGPQTFAPVWQAVSPRLLAAQSDDGGWPASTNRQEPGRTYATAMTVLTLTVPYGFLPVYEQ